MTRFQSYNYVISNTTRTDSLLTLLLQSILIINLKKKMILRQTSSQFVHEFNDKMITKVSPHLQEL